MAEPRDTTTETISSLNRLGDSALIFAGTLALTEGEEAVKRYGVPRQRQWFTRWALGREAVGSWHVNPRFQERVAAAWRTMQLELVSRGHIHHVVVAEDSTDAPDGHTYLVARDPMHPKGPGVRILVESANDQQAERAIRIDALESAAQAPEA